MKRFIHGLLVATLLVGSAAAKTYSDKTFLAPRNHGMNMAMEYTGWHKQTSLIDDDKLGGTFQLTAFYEKSENRKDLGTYFGVRNWKNGNCCVNDFITVVPTESGAATPFHFSATDVLHAPSRTSTDFTLADKLVWKPYRKTFGIRLDYHQKLDKILKGLYFKVSMPVVHVKTSMGWTSTCVSGDLSSTCRETSDCGSTCEGACATACTSVCTPCVNPCGASCTTTCGVSDYCVKQPLEVGGTLSGAEKSLGDYLTGCVSNDDATAKQVALCRGKIHNGQSKTAIADIDITLGYNFVYEPTKHVAVNMAVTVPTGNSPKAEYLWEPVAGNGCHWAFGAGMDTYFQVWKDKKMALDFVFAFNYRYLFCGTEKRIAGFMYPGGDTFNGLGWAWKRAPYGHWMLGASKGDTHATPMANFLARDMHVTPGSHFECITQLAFSWNKLTFDLGYNMFAKVAEQVRLKNNPCSPCDVSCSTEGVSCGDCAGACTSCMDGCSGWANDTYALIKYDWDTTNEFAGDYVYADGETYEPGGDYEYSDWINREHLCLDACTSPSVFTHKIYGGMTYELKKWKYPVMLGLGGSYEFETDNDCLNGWAVWLKGGLTF